jgi:hypothetical protein
MIANATATLTATPETTTTMIMMSVCDVPSDEDTGETEGRREGARDLVEDGNKGQARSPTHMPSAPHWSIDTRRRSEMHVNSHVLLYVVLTQAAITPVVEFMTAEGQVTGRHAVIAPVQPETPQIPISIAPSYPALHANSHVEL